MGMHLSEQQMCCISCEWATMKRVADGEGGGGERVLMQSHCK